MFDAPVPPDDTPLLDACSRAVTAAVERAGPAVVHVSAHGRRGAGAGSGVAVSPDGPVLTNAHVAAGATALSVTTAAGRTMPARPVGAAPDTDLALLRAESDTALPTAELGASAALRVGQLAIGMATRSASPPPSPPGW